ncbi:hypothetical protein, partial [Bacillus phage SPG24]
VPYRATGSILRSYAETKRAGPILHIRDRRR